MAEPGQGTRAQVFQVNEPGQDSRVLRPATARGAATDAGRSGSALGPHAVCTAHRPTPGHRRCCRARGMQVVRRRRVRRVRGDALRTGRRSRTPHSARNTNASNEPCGPSEAFRARGLRLQEVPGDILKRLAGSPCRTSRWRGGIGSSGVPPRSALSIPRPQAQATAHAGRLRVYSRGRARTGVAREPFSPAEAPWRRLELRQRLAKHWYVARGRPAHARGGGGRRCRRLASSSPMRHAREAREQSSVVEQLQGGAPRRQARGHSAGVRVER